MVFGVLQKPHVADCPLHGVGGTEAQAGKSPVLSLDSVGQVPLWRDTSSIQSM